MFGTREQSLACREEINNGLERARRQSRIKLPRPGMKFIARPQHCRRTPEGVSAANGTSRNRQPSHRRRMLRYAQESSWRDEANRRLEWRSSEPRGRAAMKRGKFVDVTGILACSLQGIATGGLHCPGSAQRRRASFSWRRCRPFLK
jgi:hypothetical protein